MEKTYSEVKHNIGDIFKETPRWSYKIGQWKLVTPSGMLDTFNTRRAAIEMAMATIGHYQLVSQ